MKHVHRSQIAKHAAGQNRVPLRAAFQMVHVQSAVQPVHLPILVPAIIPVVVVNRRASHVRDVIHGHAPVLAPVLAEHSALHAMPTIINLLIHVWHARPFHIPTVVHNPAASQTVPGLKPIHALVTAAPVQRALRLHRHVPAHPVAAAIHMVHAT